MQLLIGASRIRFGLRALILLVAASALLMAGVQLARRRAYCLHRERVHRGSLMPWNGGHAATPVLSFADEDRFARTSPHARWHLDLAAAYRRAARRPWESLPVEPEEPIDFLIPPDQQVRPGR